MRIALFGGSFNPPHVGHQMAALYVLETAAVDALWFVPAFRHPCDKPLADFDDRMRMCELAAAALGPRARVSDIERELGGPSRTLRTVQTVMQRHPADHFSLIIGADLIGEVDTWTGAAELRRLISFVVVGRAGRSPSADPNSAGASGAAFAAATGSGVDIPDVNSTEIRAALAAGRSPSDLLPKSVLDYIASRGLYGSPPPTRKVSQNR
jgi:nicotinate-nucleotide adenylyltransferase